MPSKEKRPSSFWVGLIIVSLFLLSLVSFIGWEAGRTVSFSLKQDDFSSSAAFSRLSPLVGRRIADFSTLEDLEKELRKDPHLQSYADTVKEIDGLGGKISDFSPTYVTVGDLLRDWAKIPDLSRLTALLPDFRGAKAGFSDFLFKYGSFSGFSEETVMKKGLVQVEKVGAKTSEAVANYDKLPGLLSSLPRKAMTANLGGSNNKPFGGFSKDVIYCNCSNNYLITLQSVSSSLPSEVIYKDGESKQYAYGQALQPKRWLLGLGGEKERCRIRVGDGCITIGEGPKILIVGSSGGTGTPPPPPGDYENEPPPATTTPPNPPISPNCGLNNIDGWRFNPGIDRQRGDASASLKNLLYCMCNSLQQKGVTGLITSIGDGNHVGRLTECRAPSRFPQCQVGIQTTNCCWHGATSCHYGGTHSDGKSYAVDIGMSNKDLTIQAARQCGAGYVLNEGNHLHIQTSDCRQ